MTDAEVLSNLLKQTLRKITEISGDGAYDTKDCTKLSVESEKTHSFLHETEPHSGNKLGLSEVVWL